MMAAFCRRNMQLFIFASSVDIATRFVLDGLEIESRCCQITALVQNGPGAHPASYAMCTVPFPGGIAAGA